MALFGVGYPTTADLWVTRGSKVPLGPTIRTAIWLRYIEERSIKETAQILGTSITAVKARVFQGRRKLRKTLNTGFLRGLWTHSAASV